MAAETPPTEHTKHIAAAVQEVTDRAQVLIREEIELARAEVTLKAKRLARGAAIGAIAGVFVLAAVTQAITGFSWLAFFLLPVNNLAFFWGFFLIAFVFLLLGGAAGILASKLIKSGSPPKPDLAIEEAQRIKETVRG